MKNIDNELIEWGQKREDVRAMILTSSRTNPNSPVDLFSDYDIILVVNDIQPYFKNSDWLSDFGTVLVVWQDPIRKEMGCDRFADITQYEDGGKIDFTFWPVELLNKVATEPKLPENLDIGYTVLLDKNGLTTNLQKPSYHAHIPSRPTELEYKNRVEEFFHESTYVAKHLWRKDLLSAKFNFDEMMKQTNLRIMIEWFVECGKDWSWKPGAYGKGLHKVLKPELYKELEATYVGADIEENWNAMFKTIALFRKVATEVGAKLGYEYPINLDNRTTKYLECS